MFSAFQKILPTSETSYFPYFVEGGAGDSTGKFEKTYVGDSPTMLIDPSKMLDEGPDQLQVQGQRSRYRSRKISGSCFRNDNGLQS